MEHRGERMSANRSQFSAGRFRDVSGAFYAAGGLECPQDDEVTPEAACGRPRRCRIAAPSPSIPGQYVLNAVPAVSVAVLFAMISPVVMLYTQPSPVRFVAGGLVASTAMSAAFAPVTTEHRGTFTR